MRTSSRPSLGLSHSHNSSNSQAPHSSRHGHVNAQPFCTNRSTTPMASPRMPHSVGQPYPPTHKSQISPVLASDVRTPSPNYFGLNIEPTADPGDSGALARENWSPSSSVKSFGAAIPRPLPLDANPEFEAFRRQADANRSRGFFLNNANTGMPPPPPSMNFPKQQPGRWSKSLSETSDKPWEGDIEREGDRKAGDSGSLHDSAYISSDSKRNSEVSMNPPSFFGGPQHESPAPNESPLVDSPFVPARRSNLSKVEDAQPRLSLPQSKSSMSPPTEGVKPRAETLPSSLEGGPTLIMPNQLRDIIQKVPKSDFLLLDVRVSTHYSQSRIQGALNLCIPTTLLKRATFDLKKLQKTLLTDQDQEAFSRWQRIKYLIVYDGSSLEKRDAMSAMNMFKKFTNEGYSGASYLLRGGFDAFATALDGLVDHRSPAERSGHSNASTNSDGRPTFAPVIGGVALPLDAGPTNAFFGNIRQNTELADGVGQMDIAKPDNIDSALLPQWLRTASLVPDHGKVVSEKFLKIERAEQLRMKQAYSSFQPTKQQDDSSKTTGSCEKPVSLSGIEKGGKNRYKDILPFDHARVQLAHKIDGACDYINASHIKAPGSNKRYIAAQGPLPSTFNDFWSVVWDQDVRVIVMLTAESEGGQLKCHNYWSNREFGPITVTQLSEMKVSLDMDKHRAGPILTGPSTNTTEAARRRANTTSTASAFHLEAPPTQTATDNHNHVVMVRKFAVRHAGIPFAPLREITQLHYASWPDFGAPARPAQLLGLVELANKTQQAAIPLNASAVTAFEQAPTSWFDEPEPNPNARPILVHCSAGCGRTGTFCTVDSVIDTMRRQELTAASRKQPGETITTPKRPRDADGDIDLTRSFSADIGQSPQGPNSIDNNQNKSSLESGDWPNNESVDLIEKTVENFREQRLSMVQSLRQFVLCYETVLEWMSRRQSWNRGGVGNGKGDVGDANRGAKRGRARSGSMDGPPLTAGS